MVCERVSSWSAPCFGGSVSEIVAKVSKVPSGCFCFGVNGSWNPGVLNGIKLSASKLLVLFALNIKDIYFIHTECDHAFKNGGTCVYDQWA